MHELKDADIGVTSVTTDDIETIVDSNLDATEIINSHNFTELEFNEPKTFKEKVEDILKEKGLIQ